MTVIFGGAFNPPHKAHVELVTEVAKRDDVEKILIVPTFLSPHKDAANTSFYDRLNMCKAAFLNIQKAEICDIEKHLSGKSYTLNTLTALKQKGEENLSLIIGADMAESFNTWYKYEEVLKLCKLLVYKRNDSLDLKVLDSIKANYEVMEYSPLNISSSEYRASLKEELLPVAVLDYIKSHSLYGYDEIYKAKLKENLKEKRYTHCLNVAQSAMELALKYGADINKAYTAGLLHDITKELEPETQLKLCEELGIIISSLEKNAFKLWHAITGAHYVKNILKIKDDEIFDAIRYHTTAKENMSLITKIIYIADYISAERDYNGVEEMREAASRDLEKAIQIATEFTVNDLISKKRVVHPDTLKAFNQYSVKRD